LSIVIVTSQLQKSREHKKGRLAISYNKHMFAIIRATIPSLFVRFVPGMKGTVLANFIVLTSKKCTYYGLVSRFCLIFSNNVRKRPEAINDLEVYFCFLAKRFGPPRTTWIFLCWQVR